MSAPTDKLTVVDSKRAEITEDKKMDQVSFLQLYADLTLDECVQTMIDSEGRADIINQISHRRWDSVVALVAHEPDTTLLCLKVSMAAYCIAGEAGFDAETMVRFGLVFGIAHYKLSRFDELDKKKSAITKKQA